MSIKLRATGQALLPGGLCHHLPGEFPDLRMSALSSVGKADVVACRDLVLPLILFLRDQARLFKQVFFNNSSVIKGKRRNKMLRFNIVSL